MNVVLFSLTLLLFAPNLANEVYFIENYHRGIRPHAYDGIADNVAFDVYVHKVGPIEESEMRITMDVFFRQYWTDYRLIELFDHIVGTTNQSNSSSLPLIKDYVDLIWLPDIYWVDALEVSKPGILSRSQSLELDNTGGIFFSSRLLIKFRCEMKLKYFPFDLQECNLCFESYLYHAGMQNMSWVKKILSVSESQIAANFFIDDKPRTSTFYSTYGLGTVWENLCVKVKLSRKVAIYVITMFLPSISLVLLSWVGFWVDKRAVPARSGLSITTILAQITLIVGTARQFPGIADLKMGDLYLIVNFFYVFASLVEFALVSYEAPQRTKWKKTREQKSMREKMQKMKRKALRGIGRLRRNRKKTAEEGIGPGVQVETPVKPDAVEAQPEESIRSLFTVKSLSIKRDRTAAETDNNNTLNEGTDAEKNQEVENLSQLKDDQLLKLDKFDYWSIANADEISKWLFPLCFAIWNITYFCINFKLSGRT